MRRYEVDDEGGRLVVRPRRPLWALPLRVLVRSAYVADAFGVDLRRRGRRVSWGQVDHVEKPGPFDDVVTLRLASGPRCRTGLPAHLAARVADLARVPLRD
ncbi:hypothetical protein H9L10_12135 [Phycicoccus endophyticus]|uniref:Uncharacterized protein n=1 Tax=Phycicoccus endophyticus TaxID=1690220 RepID=A0A7G9R069_9MICO|nr:hypothetical protein [Phycicoccus endophyticus]NHI20211.1 hypothetical protein [Phycicoccus endophyticus]QNN48994.1 hypothetical protein H9L10_12135 [Phycicoccus endophyticus]GGL44372.1 hypothetical protein GCM10012283_28730 [Phycicoccus endophyticus]